MKINTVINRKHIFATLALAASALSFAPSYIKAEPLPDTFEYAITPKGITNKSELKNAPNPSIKIQGENRTARIVVDLSKNILYKYNDFGQAENAYKVASGKRSTPTHKGIRIVSHVETYPYKSAVGTKRKRNPRDYGPKVIVLKKLNPDTGEQTRIGEFIHGNRNASTLGMYVSHGCIRMDNEVIKQLSKEIFEGDIVIIK